MSVKKKILYPTDFTECAERSLEMAKFLTKTFDAELFLLHSIEAPSGVAKMFSGFDEEASREKANKALTKYISLKFEDDILVSPIVKVGKPYEAIIRAANDISPYLIVMGTHGLSGIKEYFVGSNASKTIRQAPCPVLSIKNTPDHLGFKKILLPLDLTKETGEKVVWGVEMAKKFKAELYVLTVLTSKDSEEKARLEKRMNKATSYITSKDVPVVAKMIQGEGNIGDEVMDYSREVGADLICIMTQQESEGNIKEAALGTNAAHVVNNSEVPVLSIKPTKEYRDRHYSSAVFH